MITHLSDSRGKADHGWLKSHHTFSFAGYYDPERMGFGALRVINDDLVEGGMGFATHGHKDMEIITIPLTGALAHKDSVGNSSIIQKGEVQIMSAGTGIRHSEFNASHTEPVTLLQIWVIPEREGLPPRYEQKRFDLKDRLNKFQMVVSPDGRDDSVIIKQDAYFALADLEEGKELTYTKHSENNGMYIFIIEGSVSVNGENLSRRDAAGITDDNEVTLISKEKAEILIMEVPL